MTYIRRSGGQIALLVLSLLGIAISIYLTVLHYEHTLPVCSTTGLVDCASVLTSSYSVVPGTTIPITVPGLLWFAVSAALAVAALIVHEQRMLRVAECVWASLGMLTVLYLVYVEIVRIHKICAWCTGLHVVILMTLLITIVQLQQAGFEAEPEMEEEKPTVSAIRK